jgi:hypothetical protein
MRKIIYFLLFGTILPFLACEKKQNSCEEEKLSAVFLMDYPDTVYVNQTFSVKTDYLIENTCGMFERFEGELNENVLNVKLIVKYSGCSCTEEFIEKSVNYPITFIEAGDYELRFWLSENDYDSYFIHVES